MVCKNCGKILEDGVKFCSSCGTKIDDLSEKKSEAVRDVFGIDRNDLAMPAPDIQVTEPASQAAYEPRPEMPAQPSFPSQPTAAVQPSETYPDQQAYNTFAMAAAASAASKESAEKQKNEFFGKGAFALCVIVIALLAATAGVYAALYYSAIGVL
ncbi:MAG: zinc ribbon domain-containing protein [Ruminiclostridium sp.]|nr:zinc ribbon domain-containing protein [Ruminiclostridium sp.]